MEVPFLLHTYIYIYLLIYFFHINYLNTSRNGCEKIFWESNVCELLKNLETAGLEECPISIYR